MLETAVALVFGHMIADFLLQTDEMVRNKKRWPVLLLHVGIVALASWAALGLALAPGLIALIAVSHLVIDALKVRCGGDGFASFALDQAAHLAAIAVGAMLSPAAWTAGLWGYATADAQEWLSQAMALGAGLIAAVWAGGIAVKTLTQELALPADPSEDRSLPRGGRLIGRLERLMILMMVLAGQTGAIGFLIAAKSVLRFSEIARDQDRRVSEYVIIGTLASFAWALAVALATSTALTALRAP